MLTDTRSAVNESTPVHVRSLFTTSEPLTAVPAKAVQPPEPPQGEIMRPPTSPEPPVDHAGTSLETPEPRAGEIRNGPGSRSSPLAQPDDRMLLPELGTGSWANRFAVQAGQMVLLPSWWVGEYSRPTFTVLES